MITQKGITNILFLALLVAAIIIPLASTVFVFSSQPANASDLQPTGCSYTDCVKYIYGCPTAHPCEGVYARTYCRVCDACRSTCGGWWVSKIEYCSCATSS